jgi:HlyD family secretion protein
VATRADPAATVTRIVLLVALGFALAGCERPPSGALQGYVEAEYVRLAAPFAGRLERLAVARGAQVKKGDALFALEARNEAEAKSEAEARVRAAEARLDNLRKGKRPIEVAVVSAQLEQAIAARDLARAQLARDERLVAQGFISKERLDQSRTAVARESAHVAELEHQRASARLTAGREDEIRAAADDVKAARAVLAQRDWAVEQKAIEAPVDAVVHDTLYVVGEWVAAGAPVISLLPPANLKVRFFVPEPQLARVAIGGTVAIACDGCGAPIAARVSYLSTSAEYTPPVIYGRETRAKLVYMVEARPAPSEAVKLRPGQPVDVSLQ